MEEMALKAAMVLPALVLQKPFSASKSKDHTSCLERRMKKWEDGHLIQLFHEAQSIQARLTVSPTSNPHRSILQN